MDDKDDSLLARAGAAGVDSFMETVGELPERFRLLQRHAPATFAGYGLIRAGVMREAPAGALDMRTKELMFVGLSTLHGDRFGAEVHAIAALRLGATLPQVAEVLTQVIMVGGITPWNLVGHHVMLACEAHVGEGE